jgi:hypothetical protein
MIQMSLMLLKEMFNRSKYVFGPTTDAIWKRMGSKICHLEGIERIGYATWHQMNSIPSYLYIYR